MGEPTVSNERFSLTRYQWLVLIVAWLGWVFDVFDTALYGQAKVPMLTEFLGGEAAFKLRSAEVDGLIGTIFLVGWAIGGLIFGALADRWGRTKVLTLTILLYCLFTGLTALCQTWEQVAAVRFLTALGIGGEWAAGAALVAEVLPNRARAFGAAMLQTAAALGPILAATANLTLKLDWRYLFLIGIFPAVLTIIIRLYLKEPPSSPAHKPPTALEPIRRLFATSKWRKHAVWAMVLGVVGIAGAGNIAYWMPNLVKHVSEGVDPRVIQDRTAYATYIQHTGTLLGVLVFPWLCNRIGRKIAFGTFFVLAMLGTAIGIKSTSNYQALLVLAPILSFLSIGLTAGYGLYFPELFPTSIRATGLGFAYNVARILNAPVPWLTGLLIGAEKGDPTHGVAMAAGIYLLGILSLGFLPETRGQELPSEESA